MCSHDWVPDIDIATGRVRAYECLHCFEERPETKRGLS